MNNVATALTMDSMMARPASCSVPIRRRLHRLWISFAWLSAAKKSAPARRGKPQEGVCMCVCVVCEWFGEENICAHRRTHRRAQAQLVSRCPVRTSV